jgi:nucleoside-diphosphate-sugar epimerase
LKKIFITGASGFVGSNIISKLKNRYEFTIFKRDSEINITEDIVIHAAGKAHDLKNTSDPNDYYTNNTDFTKNIFENFLSSDAKIFIFLSSVKAAVDHCDDVLTEDVLPKPDTHYGKSKLLAEKYILDNIKDKRVYILRPCLIYGDGSKGNLALLNNKFKNGFPWPLSSFKTMKSFCSIDNLIFIINELILNENIQSGIYNISDDDPILVTDLIKSISNSNKKNILLLKFPKSIIFFFAKIGDLFNLQFNSEKLNKLTENFVVSNKKITNSLSKDLPIKAKDGLTQYFNNLNKK